MDTPFACRGTIVEHILVSGGFFFFWGNLRQPLGVAWTLLQKKKIYILTYRELKRLKNTRARGDLQNKQIIYTGRKLLQVTSFNLSTADKHLCDQRERSSLHLLEIIRFVSSSYLKTLAFLHFQIFHKTQIRTVLLTLKLFSWKGFSVQSWSTPIPETWKGADGAQWNLKRNLFRRLLFFLVKSGTLRPPLFFGRETSSRTTLHWLPPTFIFSCPKKCTLTAAVLTNKKSCYVLCTSAVSIQTPGIYEKIKFSIAYKKTL